MKGDLINKESDISIGALPKNLSNNILIFLFSFKLKTSITKNNLYENYIFIIIYLNIYYLTYSRIWNLL